MNHPDVAEAALAFPRDGRFPDRLRDGRFPDRLRDMPGGAVRPAR